MKAAIQVELNSDLWYFKISTKDCQSQGFRSAYTFLVVCSSINLNRGAKLAFNVV